MNMWTIREEIRKASHEAGVLVTEVSPDEVLRIRCQILRKFASHLDRWPSWIWEYFDNAVYFVDENAWQWIGKFSSRREVIMLFAADDEPCIFSFADGDAVCRVLERCCYFEFYLTNRDTEYVLCHNHHDCVIATGTAMSWLEDRKAKRDVALRPESP